MPRSPGSIFTAVAVLAAGAVALALVLQHAFGMEPCAWCTFQRVIFLAVAAAALLAAALRPVRAAFALAGALVVLLAAGGVWAALHQQFVASKADSCAYTFADRFLLRTGLDEKFPALFEATASCADANAPLLGLPFAAWSAALFALLCLASIAALRTGLRRTR
ncbi:disulfide bond formation protein B [Burkholderiaceae bacterium FT117]|uniref:disulfide bond formation protein B n=1 Tax=Zeimonas sediminis TaxID=2944268 RepID=UPI0023431B94|nr:disulfide bond formation protein B [Zeimonas sediminis]MCM5572261.1 disulfide bond formation protein B [Zeimonas sediminis]